MAHIAKKKTQRFDCASCQGNNWKCLLINPEIEVEGHQIRIDNWQELLNISAEKLGHANLPEIDVMMNFSVCPIPLFSPLSFDALRLHKQLNGLGAVDFFTLQEYPNILIEANNIIQGTLNIHGDQ